MNSRYFPWNQRIVEEIRTNLSLDIFYSGESMSGDKRSVATDALETLGTIIDDKQKRDAIHLAVEPVIAGEDLNPGEHITVTDGIATSAPKNSGLGIVDPFIARMVMKGERFWFVMYPRMVHSLRHVWTHPAFPNEPQTSDIEEEVPPAIISVRKIESEKWLRTFCSTANCPDYETVIELIDKGSLSSTDKEYYENDGEYDEEYLLFRGRDAHGSIPLEFWKHVEIVLGRKLEFHPAYFTCSC